MNKNEMTNVGEEIVKRKKRVGNPAVTGDAIDISPSDNAKYLMQALKIANMPNIDLQDVEQVQQRINEYFILIAENGNKPTVTGLGLALNGMDRRRLWEIKTGNETTSTPKLPSEVKDLIKKAYKIMEELWEDYMQNGKINPVAGIFLGKNHYGYQDKTEYVLTPNTEPETGYSADEIAARYVLPTPNDSDSAEK